MFTQKFKKPISVALILCSFMGGFGIVQSGYLQPIIRVIAATLGYGTCPYGAGAYGDNDCTILTLGTSPATVASPITGQVGNSFPSILMNGGNLPAGTVAIFTLSNGIIINGTINGVGTFVPNTSPSLQNITAAMVGITTGTLSAPTPAGIVPVANIPTNFTPIVIAPTLGTTPTTTTTGTVGAALPNITLVGFNIPDGTPAVFTPAGGTAIPGTINGGVFTPTAPATIPAGTLTGTQVGVLTVTAPAGVTPLNINTNFSPAAVPNLGTAPTTPVIGVISSTLPTIILGSNLPDNTVATFTPQGGTAIPGKIIGGNFVPDAPATIPTGTTTGAGTTGVVSVTSLVGISSVNVPTNFSAANVVLPTSLNLKVYLSGNYNAGSDTFSNILRTSNLIPTTQPYSSSPFSYGGTESVPTIPSDVVDWVLVEIKDTNGGSIQKKAALLKLDGTVVDSTPGATSVTTPNITTSGNYQVVIRHRNHLAIATNPTIPVVINGSTTVDMTNNLNVKGSNQLPVGTKFAMRLANINGNDAIDSLDRTLSRNAVESINIYEPSDVNLDGVTDSLDRTLTRLAVESVENL
jgi:hypothetical protein